MKTRRVNRYYCDFCKKAGGSAFHLRNHEERCTMNPQRKCGMCALWQGDTMAEIHELLAVLPERHNQYLSDREVTAISGAVEKLREMTDSCPICIYAALRQRGYHWSEVGFGYDEERRARLAEINDRANDEFRQLVGPVN